MLTDGEIADFIRDGFVPVRSAVPQPTVDACLDLIWVELAGKGLSRDDPATWTTPVASVNCPEGGPFVAAGTAEPLWEAYDQLLGPGTWWKRAGVGGAVPVRFPHRADPGDAGWHVESSFPAGDTWRANVRSRDRGLLAIFLFTDVGPVDAPTRLRVGSHADAARVLAGAGEDGLDGETLAPLVDEASTHRPVALATGSAGDVFLCHPFVVHAASWPHQGTVPRAIAQPGVALLEPLQLADRASAFPVEAAILDALETRTT
jgi:Phytanoyl-CoA dioxygenase (PhyH)